MEGKVTMKTYLCVVPSYRKLGKTAVYIDVLDELYQTIKLMQEINQGIADVNAGRTVSLENAKKKLL